MVALSGGRSPTVALTGARPATNLTQSAMASGDESSEGALARVFEVDDVDAGRERHLGLGAIAHTGEEQGHQQAKFAGDEQPDAVINGTAS